jgi:hypothetical protein
MWMRVTEDTSVSKIFRIDYGTVLTVCVVFFYHMKSKVTTCTNERKNELFHFRNISISNRKIVEIGKINEPWHKYYFLIHFQLWQYKPYWNLNFIMYNVHIFNLCKLVQLTLYLYTTCCLFLWFVVSHKGIRFLQFYLFCVNIKLN